MSAVTPGQAAREAFGELGADWYPGTPWSGLHEDLRAQWDAAAQAAIDTATEGTLRACGYTLADVARFLEAEAAAREPHAAPEFFDDVHVDWHMTPGEWRQLYTVLGQHADDTPYIARLIEAGKVPAPSGGAKPAPELAELRREVQEAIGAASVCWEPMDCTGVFDGDRALQIADGLMEVIGRYVAEPLTVRPADDVKPAPELAGQLGDWPKILADVTQQRDTVAEDRDRYRNWLDDFTRVVLDIADRAALVRAAKSIRRKAQLEES